MGHEKDLAPRHLIMLLDDDAGMRISLRFLLELCGYAVADYGEPARLLGDLADMAPACAIIDIHLPDTDGIAVGRAARGLLPDLAMILITGRVDQRIRDGAAELGAVALLEKPFADGVLLAAVRQAIGAPARPDMRGIA